eukprot:SAG31_NODE_1290_length_8981_cov_2.829543_6_plen_173_part_00
MSTSTSKAVALHYSKDRNAERGLSFVLEFEMDGLNRGAMIKFLSQYPAEAEVLFGPLTGLELMDECWLRGSTRHIRFRPTTNQRAVLIEQLVAQRQLLHVEMVKNLRAELKGGATSAGKAFPAPDAVLGFFDRHRTCVSATDPAKFNDDSFYKGTRVLPIYSPRRPLNLTQF